MPFDLGRAPGHLIRRAQQRHTTLWAALVPADVTGVQFAILAALDAWPEIDQRLLGERVSLDSSTVGDVCARLQRRGLIERHRDPRDARRYVLVLTPEGRAVLGEVIPAVEEVGRRLLERLEPDERERFLGLVARVMD